MKTSRFKVLLKRYFHGKSTFAERHIIDRWYDELENGKANNEHMFSHDEVSKIENKIISTVQRDKRRSSWYRVAAAASVVLCCCLALTDYYFSSRDKKMPISQVLRTETGSRQIKKLVLPDSSVVWLNANSSIEYDKGNDYRTVRLKGEANFEVKGDSRIPFQVISGEMTVKVLGTAFNVKSYTSLDIWKVTVSSGKVSVAKDGAVLSYLSENQELLFDKQKRQFDVSSLNATLASSWRNGVTTLQKASFAELKQAVKNLYDLDIRSSDAEITNNKYTLILKSTMRKEEVLELLSGMMEREFKYKGGNDEVIY